MSYDRLCYLGGGVKDSFTAYANETISGGQIVSSQSSDDTVGSNIDSFAGDEIKVIVCNSNLTWVGVAEQTVGSGYALSVLTKGRMIFQAGSQTATPGYPVCPEGYGDRVGDLTLGSLASTVYPMGRALTGATKDGYFVCQMNI